jgi:hypothetical protein
MITHELINEVCEVFGFDFGQPNTPKERTKLNKIIHVNKKIRKIISVVMNEQPSKGVLRDLLLNADSFEQLSNSCSFPLKTTQ